MDGPELSLWALEYKIPSRETFWKGWLRFGPRNLSHRLQRDSLLNFAHLGAQKRQSAAIPTAGSTPTVKIIHLCQNYKQVSLSPSSSLHPSALLMVKESTWSKMCSFLCTNNAACREGAPHWIKDASLAGQNSAREIYSLGSLSLPLSFSLSSLPPPPSLLLVLFCNIRHSIIVSN